MKDGSIIKWHAVLGGAADGILPLFGAIGQADEVGHSFGSLFLKQFAGELAGGSVNDGCGLARTRRLFRGLCFGRWRRLRPGCE